MFPTIKWSGFSKNSLQSIWPLWRTYFCIKALQLFTTYIFIFFSSVMMATQKESSTTFIFCSIFTCTWLKTTILLVVIPDSTWMTFYLLWHREKPCCTRKSTFNWVLSHKSSIYNIQGKRFQSAYCPYACLSHSTLFFCQCNGSLISCVPPRVIIIFCRRRETRNVHTMSPFLTRVTT